MQRLRGFRRRFRFPWRADAEIRQDVDDELEFHLAAKADALQRDGWRPDSARDEALRQFGDLAAARDQLVAADLRSERQSQHLRLLDDLWRDLRMAARSLRRTPAFTAVGVLVLALGIGVVSAAFHLVNIYGFKPALIEEPDRVLGVYSVQQERRGRGFAYAEYAELRERVETIANLAAHSVGDAGIEEGDVTRRAQVAFVSANYFDTLGVPPALGRGFTLAEERGDEPPTVVVSHDFWIRNGASPNMLGSLVRVNGEPLVIVGIAARGFTGTMALLGTEAWLPLAAVGRIGDGHTRPNLADPQNRSLLLFGRLADGVSAAEAGAELTALAPLVVTNLPDGNGDRFTYVAGKMQRTAMSSAPSTEGEPLGGLLLPIAMSGVVLLIACLNLANMFLARGASRRKEMAIRQSLGSGRLRLVRQLVTEGLLLATLGGAVGLLWTYWAANWVIASASKVVPLGVSLTVDTRPDLPVLLVTVGACVAAALLFGLGPAWRVTGTDVLSGLKEIAGDVQFKRRRARTIVSGKGLLLIAQIALSLAMLTAGGLFVRSAIEAADATPSFDLDATLLVELDPSLAGNDATRVRALYIRVMERVRALPEVESAGLSSLVPFSGISRDVGWIQPAGAPPGENTAFGYHTVIGDDFFAAVGAPMLRGRGFTVTEATSSTGPRVAIVSESLARRLFPDTDALGRQIQTASESGQEPIVMEIVGIAPGMPGPDFDSAPRQHLYVPFGQAYTAGMSLLVAARANVADPVQLLAMIRDEIRDIDPALPVLSMMTMREYRNKNWSLWFTRIGGQLFTVLGLVGLLMAMVGLYGVTAFLMSRRTREIGIRMALGATRGAVLRRFMRESIRLTAAGIALGLLLALGAGRLLSSQLYGVSPRDPWVLLGASALLALAATAASWLPVSRALRVAPSAALRDE